MRASIRLHCRRRMRSIEVRMKHLWLFFLAIGLFACEKGTSENPEAATQTGEQQPYIDKVNDDLKTMKSDLQNEATGREGELDQKVGNAE